MKSIIIVGILLACVATTFCQADPFDDAFHSSQKANGATGANESTGPKEAPRGVIQLEGTIAVRIQDGVYLVDVTSDCAEKYGFGRSHDDPTYVQGTNNTVIVEHVAVHELVRVVLLGEPQERNDVTISCWVTKAGLYRYTKTGSNEMLQSFKVCPAPEPAASGKASK